MTIARPSIAGSPPDSNRGRLETRSILNFSNEDKVGTLQSYDDSLVVTLKIGGYDSPLIGFDGKLKPDLFKGLKLRPKNLSCYDSPLIRFDG